MFSSNGGILREQLVSSLIERIDLYGWRVVQTISVYLPKNLIPKSIKHDLNENRKEELMDIEPLKKVFDVLSQLPGYSSEMVRNKIIRLIKEPITREMSLEIAQGVAERSMVRFVKVAAGVTV